MCVYSFFKVILILLVSIKRSDFVLFRPFSIHLARLLDSRFTLTASFSLSLTKNLFSIAQQLDACFDRDVITTEYFGTYITPVMKTTNVREKLVRQSQEVLYRFTQLRY